MDRLNLGLELVKWDDPKSLDSLYHVRVTEFPVLYTELRIDHAAKLDMSTHMLRGIIQAVTEGFRARTRELLTAKTEEEMEWEL